MEKSPGQITSRGKGHADLLILLQEAQDKFGYVPQHLITELAESHDISISDVYGVITFYSFLSTKPQGRSIIRICKSPPCYLKNCDTIIETVEKEIGIRPGETTDDGRFSFQLTNCIGACDKAPAMMVNDDVYGDLTPEKISQILKSYK